MAGWHMHRARLSARLAVIMLVLSSADRSHARRVSPRSVFYITNRVSGNVCPSVSTVSFERTDSSDIDFFLVMGHDRSWPGLKITAKFNICPILSKIPPKGQTRITLKLTCLQKCISDSNQILHNDNDHQPLFVCSLK